MVIHHHGKHGWTVPSKAIWGCAGMWPLCGNQGGVVCVATSGEVFEFPSRGSEEDFIESQGEHVDSSPDGPSELVHLRCVEKIGASIYCAGYARRVYRRNSRRGWTAVDQGTFVSRERRTKSIGFLGIGGLSENEIYAVGLGGEIWSCVGGQWTEESSPTNVVLNTISILPNGLACVAGMVGVVIFGRAGQWQTVRQDLTREAFWGSTVFQGRVYLANNEGIFVLSESLDEIEQVHAGAELAATTSHLDAGDEVMWSVGEKGIIRTYNGRDWHEVPAPSSGDRSEA